MDLSASLMSLLASLGVGPIWLVILLPVVTLLLKKYLPNLKLPALPVAPTPAPSPDPTPAPSPLPDVPLLPNFPRLDALLKMLLSLKLTGAPVEHQQLVGEMIAAELSKKS